MVGVNGGNHLVRAIFEFEDGFSTTYSGPALRAWESVMAEGMRLRHLMQALSSVEQETKVEDAHPASLFDVLRKEE